MAKRRKTPETGITNLLIQEDPLLVLPSLAVAIGLNEAIFLQQIHFHLRFSKNERDGRIWVYNTFEDWQKELPWWSISTLKRIVSKLQNLGLLITTSKYNKMPIDKTLWYTIDYSAVVSLRGDDVSIWHVDSVNLIRPSCQIDTMCRAKLTLPITKEDPKTYIKDLDDDDALSLSLVKEDRAAYRSARADQATPTETNPTALLVLRRAVERQLDLHTGQMWDDRAAWLDQRSFDELYATLLWCEVVGDRMAHDPDAIHDPVGFIRAGVEQHKVPGLRPSQTERIDSHVALLLDLAEKGVI